MSSWLYATAVYNNSMSSTTTSSPNQLDRMDRLMDCHYLLATCGEPWTTCSREIQPCGIDTSAPDTSTEAS